MNIHKREKGIFKENTYYLFFAFFLYSVMITDIIRTISEIWIEIPTSYVDIFRNAIYIIIFIYLFSYLFWHQKTSFLELLCMTIIYGILVLISIETTPGILSEVQYTTLLVFSRCIPAFFFARYIQDFSICFKYLQKFVLLNMLYALIPYFIITRQNYNMSMSYSLLIPAIVSLYSINIRKKYIYIIPFILFLITILLYGSRGTIICLFSIVFIYWFIQKRELSSKKRIIVFLFVCAFMFVLYFYFNNIISLLYNYYPNSRTISMIVNSNWLSLTNRDIFYETAMQIIRESPLAFRGLLSDRYLIGKVYFGLDDWIGSYAHNIILELTIEYGLIIAIIIIIALIILMIKTLKNVYKKSDNYITLFVSLAITYIFIASLFSGGYLTDYSFFLGIGILVNKYIDNTKSKDLTGPINFRAIEKRE